MLCFRGSRLALGGVSFRALTLMLRVYMGVPVGYLHYSTRNR